MWTRQYRKRNTGKLIVPALCALVLSYFGFHAYQGEYGIYAKYQLEAEIARLEQDHRQLTEERKRLQSRVRLLQDGTIDRDMLDEQIRRALNFGGGRDLVILRSGEAPLIN